MIISPDALDYLIHQRGSLWRWREWPGEWRRRYVAQLQETYELIKPHLPEHPPQILDVGCGMAGIDLLLHRHYRGEAEIALIDGDEDPAPVLRHAEPHGNVFAAMRFLAENGVPEDQIEAYLAPDTDLEGCDDIGLVISLQAWCFHFPPAAYLDPILFHAKPSCRWILDVRTSQPGWRTQLEDRLGPYETIAPLPKSDLLVFPA